MVIIDYIDLGCIRVSKQVLCYEPQATVVWGSYSNQPTYYSDHQLTIINYS